MTKPFAWIIDQDQSDSPWTQAGEIGPRGAAKAAADVLREGGGQCFRLLNGDGEVSYEGRIVMCKADDRPGFQPLTAFKWCAAIQYLDAAGDTWVTM